MNPSGGPVGDHSPRFMSQLGRLLLAGITVIAAAVGCAKLAASLGADELAAGAVFALSVVGQIAYFVPSIIAYTRNNHQSKAIFILNLLLGWTALGWIAALVWAFTNPTVVVQNVAQPPPRGAWKQCPRCAEDVRAEAVICRYCNHEFGVASQPVYLATAMPAAANGADGLAGPTTDASGTGGLRRFAVVCLALLTVTTISGVIGWLVYHSWVDSERVQALRAARTLARNVGVATQTGSPVIPSGDNSPMRQWQSAITTTIHNRMRPSDAMGTLGGRATIRFTVTRSGEVKEATIAQSSGVDQIDRAALATIQGGLPPAPEGVPQSSLTVSLPVTYRMR